MRTPIVAQRRLPPCFATRQSERAGAIRSIENGFNFEQDELALSVGLL